MNQRPSPGWYEDPKGVTAGADQDYRHDIGLTDDLLHIGQAIVRVVTWPARAVARRIRG